VIREPARRTVLRQLAASLRAGLETQGWNTGKSGSQIVPVILGDPGRTMNLARALQDRGFFVPGIRPPAVPQGESLLRISLSYLHTDEDLRRLLDALAEADAALGIRGERKA
jgi:8-amino-7-oxononanoate synthase